MSEVNSESAKLERVAFASVFAAVVALAALLRFWALDLGLPHLLTRPDEFPILEQTVLAAKGQFDFSWSVYPPAYLYLHWIWGEFWLSAQTLFGFAETSDYLTVWTWDPSRIYRIQRALSALAGVGAVITVGLATAGRFGRLGGIGAAFWLAVCFLHARDSHAIKPDALLSFFVTLAVVGAAALGRGLSLRRGILAGLAVGCAGATKYNGALVALPVCIAAWAAARRAGTRGVAVLFPKPLLAAGGAAAGFFLVTSPFLLFNEQAVLMLSDILQSVLPTGFAHPSASVADRLANVIGPETPAWATQYGKLGTLWYHLAFSLNYGIGAAATWLAVPAVVWGFASRDWLLRCASIFIVAWAFSIAASPVMLARYMTPVLPSLAILETTMVLAAAGALATRAGGANVAKRRAAIFAVAMIAIGVQPLSSAVAHERIASREDTRVSATRWLMENTPRGSRVTVVGTRFMPWGAPAVPRGWVATVPRVEHNVLSQRLDYVVTHDHELFWSRPDPEWMARNAKWLVEVADFDPSSGEEGRAIFEVNDAYYMPFAGFSAVTSMGPRVRIYRVKNPAGQSGRFLK